MPSGRRRQRPKTPKPVFFLDRSVGKYDVAEAIQSRELDVLHMSSVFPDDGQYIGDPEWIKRADYHNWIVITTDCSIISDHTDALLESSLRVFAFSSSQLTGDQMEERILHNLNRIIQHANKPGPYVYKIYEKNVKPYWYPRKGIDPLRRR